MNSADARTGKFSRLYKYYALAVVTAVYTLNLVDRGLMTLLLQPIKEDLRLTDTELGTLTGVAFALFYATLGIPIARWADRGNRVSIASLAILLWGGTVMSCLFVKSYLQILCARVAAAVGESGCKPPTYSLVGDYFPRPDERTAAMAGYWMGSPIASLISFMLGGWLNERYGWRTTFFLMGVPGIILAVVVKLTLVEPREGRLRSAEVTQKTVPIVRVFSVLWRQLSLRNLGFALILLYSMGMGLAPWYAAFMIRTHKMGTGELGVWLGAIFGLGGIFGTLLGSHVSRRWFSGNERGQLRASAVTVALLVPFFVVFLMASSTSVALVMLLPVMLGFNFFLAPTYSLLQRLVSDEMRATTLAILMMLANLIGMGLGPQVVGILSDWFAPQMGADSLRYAMLIVSLIALWGAYHFWKAADTVMDDLATAEDGQYGDRVLSREARSDDSTGWSARQES